MNKLIKKELKMAKVRNNIFVRGLSGSLGEQFVVKQDKSGRTIVSASPTFDQNRIYSEAQLQWQDKFREAATYAVGAKDNIVYAQKAAGTPLSPYNVAMADWFHAPEILELDASAWNGQVGQIIRIKAVDDIQVIQVNVVITDNAGAVLEQGAAVQSDGSWWTYTTTASGEGTQIVATARDLPGHIAQRSWD